MIGLLNLQDCFDDTSQFRETLGLFDRNGQAMETCIKHVKASLEASKELCQKNMLVAEACITFSEEMKTMNSIGVVGIGGGGESNNSSNNDFGK